MKTALPTHSAMPGFPPDMAASAHALTGTMSDALKAIASLNVPLPTLAEVQSAYVKESTALWNQMLGGGAKPASADRRFAAPEWAANPASLDALSYHFYGNVFFGAVSSGPITFHQSCHRWYWPWCNIFCWVFECDSKNGATPNWTCAAMQGKDSCLRS